MADDRIALRELGEKLKLIGRYTRSEARAKLLGLLKNEKLAARFDYPSNERPQIQLPATYWDDVKTNEFRKALDGNNKSKGDYLVSPKQFATEYLNWFLRDHRLSEHVDELSSALRGGSTMAEVYVLAKDWEHCVTQGGFDTKHHSSEPQKSSRGNRENPNWSAILGEVAVELLKADTDSRPRATEIVANALKRVVPRAKSSLPGTDTIEKKVSDIIRRGLDL